MPEHVHLLLLPHDCLISELPNSIKQSVSKRAIAWVEQEAPWFLPQMEERRAGGRVTRRFWQPGPGYDRNLRSSWDIWEKINYTHFNPVKRKLCLKPCDWKWSSAADHAGMAPGPLAIDRQSLPHCTERPR
jgi:putative transposase